MIDLHMHSLYSDDGEYSEEKLVLKCKDNHISLMSITDHDCVKANIKAKSYAEKHKIKYLNGIEITCKYKTLQFHLLAYGFKNLNFFNSFEQALKKQNKEVSLKRLALINKLGFDVDEKKLKKYEKINFPYNWPGEMFAKCLLEDERYLDNEVLKPYREGGIYANSPYINFYWNYFSQGKDCYVPLKLPLMEDVINLIHQNGGIAILAHPFMNLKGNESLIYEIIALGIDGIEVSSSYHDQDETDKYYDICQRFNLIATCGSDFHGSIKPNIQIESFLLPKAVSKEKFANDLFFRLEERGLLC